MRRLATFTLIALTAIGCSDGSNDGDASTDASGDAFAGVTLRVMTANLYLGADVSQLLDSEAAKLPEAVAGLWEAVVASKPDERMKAVAETIERLDPHVVALQEATLLREQVPGDYLQGNPKPAEDVVFDFLKLLQEALAARDLSYTIAVQQDNADIELPRREQDESLADARLTDRDVILVKDGVTARLADKQHFLNNLDVGAFEILRGWVEVVAEVEQVPYLLVNTHLESGTTAAPLRLAQTQELLDALKTESAPIVLVGDFNSPAPAGPAVVEIVKEGFIDTWLQTNPLKAGNTCCQADDLLGDSQLDKRIDIIFTRNVPGIPNAAQTALDGESDRTPSGLWPSDHAAVWSSWDPTP